MSDADYFDRQRMPATVGMGDLDQYQRAFCESEARDVRVIAPAGSGKTQTLLWRCLNLQGRVAHNPRFLVVTFTVAARAELAKRLQAAEFERLRHPVEVLEISTLNRWGWSHLWKSVNRARGEPTLVVSRNEKADCVYRLENLAAEHPIVASVARKSRSLAAGLLDHVDTLKNLDFRLDDHWTKGQFLAHCGQLARLGIKPQLEKLVVDLQKLRILSKPSVDALDKKLGLAREGDEAEEEQAANELYERFYAFGRDLFISMYRRNRFTLNDQKYVALMLLELEKARPPAGKRLSHVLVDEFQDISPLDLSLVRSIADWCQASVTIVGDDDQAIYEWRGGSPTFLLEPEESFRRRFETYVLERNYRCPRNLAQAADRLIQHNERRHEKRIEAVNEETAEIVLAKAPNTAAAVEDMMGEVRAFMAARRPQDRMALLSRKKAQLVPYQILFADEDVKFEAADDLKIFLSRAFKSLIRMIQIRARRERNQPAHQIVADTLHLCRHVTAGDGDRRNVSTLERGLKERLPSSYARAHRALQELQKATRVGSDGPSGPADYAGPMWELLAAKTVADTVRVIAAQFDGLSQDFGRGATDIFYRDPPFFYLAAVADRFKSDFRRFLAILKRAEDSAAGQEGENKAAADEPYKPVELATALRAKGKQFHTVGILDAQTGAWPSSLAETDLEKEAERRLFYVAMTRAQKRLIVSWSQADTEGKLVAPSPYLAEAGLLEHTPQPIGGDGPETWTDEEFLDLARGLAPVRELSNLELAEVIGGARTIGLSSSPSCE